VADALELEHCHLQFDNVIDCGLFHVFGDEQRPRYVASLASVLRADGHVVLMCFSDEEPGTDGPRRVSQAELRAAFADGWSFRSIEPVRFRVSPDVADANFSPGGPKAWFAVIQRRP
jgi:cyclopropane fatty-acyl-phospholipid synthase-like methyltransferase